jgi:A/G-specific adenine glycosylase
VAGRPGCRSCPIRPRCRWAARGRDDPDPSLGSAAVSTPQSRFDGSDRQGRGRLVEELRHGMVPSERLALAAGWPDDPTRAHRIAAGLVEDGLAVRDRSGNLRLP